jgi:hypothetical protein
MVIIITLKIIISGLSQGKSQRPRKITVRVNE